MDLFKLIREFYIQQSVNPLSTGQIALWHGLVYQCNQLGWPSEFNMPNRTLETLTGLSRQGIVKTRNALKQSGLIDFQTNGVKATTYSVIDISRKLSTSDSRQPSSRADDSVSDSRQHSRQPSRQHSLQSSLQPSRQHSSTYTKQDETKLDKTKRQQTTAPVKAAERPTEEPSSSSSSILDICNFWEGNGFGQLSPFTRESLVDWVDDMRKAGSPEPEKLVLNALRTAVESNVRNYKYVNGILKNWESKRLLTVAAVDANDSERKTNQPQRRYGKPERVDKEPDWLKPGYQEPKHEVTPEQRAKLAEQLKQLNSLGEKKEESK
ncbi:DnaD domain protein [Lacticaseibacillus paracasei]|uniref:Phage replication protein n=1 Tax=Lacticaseibacillus paracasei subsp. paracasei Lpp22 TaxID=1256221 RepID=A0A8E0M6K5_LACPA|nr:DnaD domain protein [Lacticaseibacillus paracasei]EPC30756.1 Phage replication protein [Lacticaseibacillus paracasei subsp. paracasei Lpp22]MCT3345047.1 DnaD domain protein [Lacticaseibacillus paracasei]